MTWQLGLGIVIGVTVASVGAVGLFYWAFRDFMG